MCCHLLQIWVWMRRRTTSFIEPWSLHSISPSLHWAKMSDWPEWWMTGVTIITITKILLPISINIAVVLVFNSIKIIDISLLPICHIINNSSNNNNIMFSNSNNGTTTMILTRMPTNPIGRLPNPGRAPKRYDIFYYIKVCFRSRHKNSLKLQTQFFFRFLKIWQNMDFLICDFKEHLII